MQRIVGVIQRLSMARDMAAIAAIVRDAARDLTGADGATFILRDGAECYYAEENAIAPLWRGRRFPMSGCVSGWVMMHGQAAVIEDIYIDPRVPVEAYRPTFVKSMVVVPVRRESPIAAIGNYWATRRRPTSEELGILQALADSTSVAILNVEMDQQLRAQLKTLESQQTRIEEQKAALEVFTRALAHDLREPTRAIAEFSRLLSRAEEMSLEQRGEYLKYVQDAAGQMSAIVDGVFTYLRLDAPAAAAPVRCDLNDALETAKQALAGLIQERGATIVSDRLPALAAAPADMVLLLRSLIDNAIRHNDAPVRVSVEACAEPNAWRLCVRDDGAGLKPEEANRIFLPFRRLARREHCVGLGLAIARKIVTQLGGKIWCESRPGQGAAFFISVPMNDLGAERKADADATPFRTGEDGEGPAASVLVVDDRGEDLELIRLMFETDASLDCRLLFARGGDEALAIMKQQQVDLVLLDINMPGMDGFEVLEEMSKRDTLAMTPVVMCTGSTYDKDRERAMSLGASEYMVKPASFEQLGPILRGLSNLSLRRSGEGWRLLRAIGREAG